MRESSLTPTNLLSWPRVEPLQSTEKFILQSLWSAPFLNSIGVGELPLRSFAVSLGFESSLVMIGVNLLQHVGLLEYDRETNEISLTDWFRFHKFKGIGIGIAQGEFKKIRSEKIRNLILYKSMGCFPTSLSSNSNTEHSPPPGGERKPSRQKEGADEGKGVSQRSGLLIENKRDEVAEERLVLKYGINRVRDTAGRHPVPYCSVVEEALEKEDVAKGKREEV